jgi:hypothetical protein
MVQFHSEAGQRLNDLLDRHVGHIEDGQGRKIYGHRRIADARRLKTQAVLRGEDVLPQVEPQMAEAPLDAVEGKNHSTARRTGAHRESGETNWRATGGSARRRVPETAAETGPHPSLQRIAPSAARAGMVMRAACAIIAVIGVAATIILDVDLLSALSALPVGKLFGVAAGRIS